MKSLFINLLASQAFGAALNKHHLNGGYWYPSSYSTSIRDSHYPSKPFGRYVQSYFPQYQPIPKATVVNCSDGACQTDKSIKPSSFDAHALEGVPGELAERKDDDIGQAK
ncbi:hypothetical protein DSO57_1038126 [Entomophthora muscae]|uniref:Uncharacterized protein n=1 Tax=Entomophthora muscae TaxID=34485 RepID=A0ACC2TXV5_9FUNG|nr:hypothetical protein DSO57_1038126 [Entomophthora muscae]